MESRVQQEIFPAQKAGKRKDVIGQNTDMEVIVLGMSADSTVSQISGDSFSASHFAVPIFFLVVRLVLRPLRNWVNS